MNLRDTLSHYPSSIDYFCNAESMQEIINNIELNIGIIEKTLIESDRMKDLWMSFNFAKGKIDSLKYEIDGHVNYYSSNYQDFRARFIEAIDWLSILEKWLDTSKNYFTSNNSSNQKTIEYLTEIRDEITVVLEKKRKLNSGK